MAKSKRKPRRFQLLPIAERFLGYVQRTDDVDSCWLWTASMRGGYGRIKHHGRDIGAHRVAWALTYGTIPDGFSILHRCDNRRCVNPAHLVLGTQRDNIQDMIAKDRLGRGFRGGQYPHAILTSEDVREIRRSPDTGRALAKRLGVSPSTISDVRRRRHWTHVT